MMGTGGGGSPGIDARTVLEFARDPEKFEEILEQFEAAKVKADERIAAAEKREAEILERTVQIHDNAVRDTANMRGEAKAEAERIVSDARAEAAKILEEAGAEREEVAADRQRMNTYIDEVRAQGIAVNESRRAAWEQEAKAIAMHDHYKKLTAALKAVLADE